MLDNVTFTNDQLKYIGYNFIQNFDTDCCIAGGSIMSVLAGWIPADVDICFYSKEDRDAAVIKAKSLSFLKKPLEVSISLFLLY